MSTRRRTRMLRVEGLEQRQLLASGISLSTSGVLTVNGTNYADTVNVTTQNDGQQLVVTRNGVTSYFDASRVNRIVENLLGGNDTSTTDPSVNKPMTINGGPGNDNLTGGSAGDKMHGSTGRDRIDGGAGDDSIFGEDDVDWLRGGPGRDSLAPGCHASDTVEANLTRDSSGKTWDRIVPENDRRYHDIILMDPTDPGPIPPQQPLPPNWAYCVPNGALQVDARTAPCVRLTITGPTSVHVVWDSTSRDFTGLTYLTYFDTDEGHVLDFFTLNVPMTIYGNGGPDTIIGGPQGDTVNGGAGSDILDGRGGSNIIDAIDGIPENDRLYFTSFDTVRRDPSSGPDVIDQMNDQTGACLYRGSTVRLVRDVDCGADPTIYKLYLNGVLANNPLRRANGPITIQMPDVASVTIDAALRAELDAHNWIQIQYVTIGGGVGDPSLG